MSELDRSVEVFVPTPSDELLAKEGYIRYLAGVSYLHAPLDTADLHGFELPTDKMQLIYKAEDLILEGLKQVITFANKPGDRSRLVNMEESYDQAAIHMMKTVETVFEFERDREEMLFPAVNLFRPAPMLNQQTYKYICHSRMGKLTTFKLMDGVFPAQSLMPDLEKRSPIPA
jgi:hypothetical protein